MRARSFWFRVGFVYVALYGLWSLSVLTPDFQAVGEAYVAAWQPCVSALARIVLGRGDLDPAGNGSGSGDALFGWMFALTSAVVAVLAAAIWTLVDRDRERDARLAPVLHTWVRYLLAANMLGYGAIKVFSSQFGDLAPEHLETPVGAFSPQVLLWTFMAYSDAYEVFTGLVELLAGVLLLPRATAFVGSIVALGATTQVLMLNLCFDVPVKLLATHLFVGSLWLVAWDGRRWFPALFLGRALAPASPEIVTTQRMRRIACVAKLAFLGTLVVGYTRFFVDEHTPEDGERAAQREAADAFPLMRHRIRLVDDRTSMWN